MATEMNTIERTVDLKPLVMDLVNMMEHLDGTGGDMAHALVFVLVMHQQKNKWTTEQMLQLWEYYVREVERMSSVVPVRFVGEA
tara:strand:- start:349 stop:600 length:252 start_codon:yes stop_codon:yes gene_type:complete